MIVPAFTGHLAQLWRVEPLLDGTKRIMPTMVPNSTDAFVTAIGASGISLAKFDQKSDKARWTFKSL